MTTNASPELIPQGIVYACLLLRAQASAMLKSKGVIALASQAFDEGVEHVTGEVGRMLGGLWGSAVSKGKSIGQKLAEQSDGSEQQQDRSEGGPSPQRQQVPPPLPQSLPLDQTLLALLCATWRVHAQQRMYCSLWKAFPKSGQLPSDGTARTCLPQVFASPESQRRCSVQRRLWTFDWPKQNCRLHSSSCRADSTGKLIACSSEEQILLSRPCLSPF